MTGALSVKCDRCGAKPGKECVGLGSGKRYEVHARRLRKAGLHPSMTLRDERDALRSWALRAKEALEHCMPILVGLQRGEFERARLVLADFSKLPGGK